ncbi:hypothetical protein RGUI_1714 [Rhodovulum sp. P5]|nr:hypothetical protein RGUI_1714 [Rhodovulum sp. P5]
MTVPEIAKLTGLAEATVYRRIRLGKPIEGPCQYGPEPKRYNFRGEMLTAPEIAERTGYSVSHVRRQISGNTYLEGEAARANFDDNFHPNCVLLTYRGKTDSISGWARRTGIPQYVINERLWRKGWTIHRILTEPNNAKPKTIRKSINRMVQGFRASTDRHSIIRMVKLFQASQGNITGKEGAAPCTR